MDQQIRDKWVAALRSGAYKQGYGQAFFSDNDTYCCLGVLYSVCNPTRDFDMIGKSYPDMDFLGDLGLLEFFEDTTKAEDFLPTDIEDTAIYDTFALLNDRYGFTFDQIANVVEALL